VTRFKSLNVMHFAMVLAVFSASLAGCGDSTRVAVEGTVTLDGAPVDGGIIQFVSAAPGGAASSQKNVSAEIKDGKYSVRASEGPNLGTYKVIITWAKKTGRTVDASGDPGNKMDETIEAIPRSYNIQSRQTVEIKSSGNKFDYDIHSAKAAKKGVNN
jgi:hypothetical protein